MSIRVSRQCTEVIVLEDPNLRVSRQQTEVIGVEDPNLRVSRQQTEVIGAEDPNFRVSRQHVEVLGYLELNLRVSRQQTEVIGVEEPNLRVSRQHTEVLGYLEFTTFVSRQQVEVMGREYPNLRVTRQHTEIMGPVNIFEASAFSILDLQQIVAPSIGGINREIYGTIQEATEYFATRLHERAWSEARAIDREKALWAATRIIDVLNFKGNKHSVNEVLQEIPEAIAETIREAEALQFLEFPRGADTEVPEEIRLATYEIASNLLDGKDPELELETLGIVSQGYASVRTSYSRNQVPIDHIINGVPSPQAWRWIMPFLRDDDQIILSRIS